MIGEVHAAHIQPRAYHQIGDGGVDLCTEAELSTGQVDADQRVGGDTVRTDSRRVGIEYILYCDVTDGEGIAYTACRHDCHIHRVCIARPGIVDNCVERIGQQIPQIVVRVHIIEVG